MTNSGTPVRISVVVASVDALRTIDDCLSSLKESLSGIAGEVIVVHPADAALDSMVRQAHQWVRVVEAGSACLVPDLWAQGFRVSRGEVVAFSTGHSTVGAAWAQSLLGAIDAGATGAGGAIDLSREAGVLETAVYFLRYSSFMPPAPRGDAHEIPGDNAAYARTALERHSASFEHGFWEMDFHRRIRPEGARLVFVDDATASIRPDFSLRTIVRHRFQHGRYFGDYRVRNAGQGAWRVALAAPLVPLVLTARIWRRAAATPARLWRALVALPALLVVGGAWAAGEAAGAMDAVRGGARA